MRFLLSGSFWGIVGAHGEFKGGLIAAVKPYGAAVSISITSVSVHITVDPYWTQTYNICVVDLIY